MRRLYHIDDWSGGLVTNTDQGDLPPNSAVKMENVRADRPGMLRGLPGYRSFKTGPAGIAGDLRYFKEVVISGVSTASGGTHIMLAWGLDGSGVQHFYYFNTDVLVNDWTEMTEYETTTILAGSSPTSTVIEITAGNASDGYYFSSTPWWIYHETTGGAENRFDLISGYDAVNGSGNREITVLYGLDTPAAGDTIHLMRFPIFNSADLESGITTAIRAFVRDEDNFKPSVVQRNDSVGIYTGRKKSSGTAGLPNHSNLWLGSMKIVSTFSDVLHPLSIAATQFHCERKFLDDPVATAIISSLASPVSSGLGLSSGDYGVVFSLVYDGYQESPIFLEQGGTLAAGQVTTLASGDDLQINLSWDRLTTKTEMAIHPGSRRMTALRIYVCTVDSDRRPTSPFLFVDELVVADRLGNASGFWTDGGGPGPYTKTVTIGKPEFEAGKSKDAELVHGYFSKIRINADFGENVNGREVAASIVSGESTATLFGAIAREEQKSFLVYSSINSALRNTQDAHPETELKDMSEHGIYEIFNIKPLGNKLAVFGENHLVILSGTEEFDRHEERGVNGYWSVASKGEKIFWGNTSSIYELVDGGKPNEIGFPIRDTWQALSSDARKKSIAVYDEKNSLFLLQANGGDIYVYDEQRKTWSTYNSDKTWEWLGIGVDGEVLATDKTDIFELFPDNGSTETITGVYEKIVDFGQFVTVRTIEMMYKLTGVVAVKVFDLEQGTDFPISENKFFAKSKFDSESQKISFRAKKIKVQLTINPTSATDHGYEIDYLSFYGEPGVQENI